MPVSRAGPSLYTGNLHPSSACEAQPDWRRVLADFNEAMPEDLGSVESTSHFLPLDLHAKFVIYTHSEARTIAEDVPEHRLIRANRLRLREYLAKNLHINWSKKFTSIMEKDDSVTLHFEDGTSATGDVLVGADGVHSHGKLAAYLKRMARR